MRTLTCIFINPCVYVHIHTYIDAKKAALNKLAKLFYFLTCKCEVAVPAEMIIGIMTTTSIATYSHTHGYKLILLTRCVCVRSDGTNFDAGIECAYRGIQPPSCRDREAGVSGVGAPPAVHPPVPISIQHGHLDCAAGVFHLHLRGADDEAPGPQHRRYPGWICGGRALSRGAALPSSDGAVPFRQLVGSARRRYS